jgi:hypothetical protein
VIANLSFAIRLLRGNPVFACLAVVSLVLAIGANTPLFTVINTLLLKAARHTSECIVRAAEGRRINVNTDWRSSMSYAIVGFGKIAVLMVGSLVDRRMLIEPVSIV